MLFVGQILDHVADLFPHLQRNRVSEVLLQDICYAALAGLAVDPDNIGFVLSAHVFRVDEQIRHRPGPQAFFFMPPHALGNSILMGSGKCGKDQFAAVRLARWHFHIGVLLVFFYDFRHIGEVQLRIYAVCKEVHCQRYDIHISCSFSVSKEGSFDSVSAGQKSQFCSSYSRSSIVMWMQ